MPIYRAMMHIHLAMADHLADTGDHAKNVAHHYQRALVFAMMTRDIAWIKSCSLSYECAIRMVRTVK